MSSFFRKAEKKTLRIVRRLCYGRNLPKKDIALISGNELNDYIFESLLGKDAFMVARYGSIEFDAALYPYILSLPLVKRYQLFIQGRIDFVRREAARELALIYPLCNNAGFFPPDITLLTRFSNLLLRDSFSLDCLGCWLDESLFHNSYPEDILFGRLSDLEPYDYNRPWTKALKGKRVLVVHPFAKSIEAQYERRELIWENPDVLPKFELKTIKAVQSIAGEPTPFHDWFEALDNMKTQMDAIEYDVAIIGCGAYGFHLAAHAKRTGHKAVHLGGATQILFGIKGKRWEELPAVSKFFNEYWIRPLPVETPIQNMKVENGCYW